MTIIVHQIQFGSVPPFAGIGDPSRRDSSLTSEPEDHLIGQPVHHDPQSPDISKVPFPAEKRSSGHIIYPSLQNQIVPPRRELCRHHSLDLQLIQGRQDVLLSTQLDLPRFEGEEGSRQYLEDP